MEVVLHELAHKGYVRGLTLLYHCLLALRLREQGVDDEESARRDVHVQKKPVGLLDVDGKHDVPAPTQAHVLLGHDSKQLLEVVLAGLPLGLLHVLQLREEEGVEDEGVLVHVLVAGWKLMVRAHTLLVVDQRNVSVDNLIVEPAILAQSQETFLLDHVVVLFLFNQVCLIPYFAVSKDLYGLPELGLQHELVCVA